MNCASELPMFTRLQQLQMLFFLRKYCTVFFIHGFVTFLPFILILTPLPLVASQQMALR